MFNKVIFYNDGHLGDTFLNKPFIKEIKKQIPGKIYAFANNKYPAEYVTDIVDEHIDINTIYDYASPHKKYTIAGDDIFINTWMPYCLTKEELIQNKQPSSDGVTYNFDNYYSCLTHVLKEINYDFDISYMLKNKSDYVLNDYVNTYESLSTIIKKDSNKKVLLYNQPAFSGQSDNVDHTHFINTLATLHPNVNFYTSADTQINLPNIINLQKYVNQPDLIQLACFSYHCDYICGPGNATTISTWTKSNINNSAKTFIIINRNDKGEAMFFKDQACVTHVVKSTPGLYNYLHTCLVRGFV